MRRLGCKVTQLRVQPVLNPSSAFSTPIGRNMRARTAGVGTVIVPGTVRNRIAWPFTTI